VADLLQSGAAWLASKMSEAAGHAVQLVRGEQTHSVTATIGRSVFETQTQSGFVESWEARDFIVLASSYPFSEPQRGDRVLDGDGIYEVCSPQGTPLYHFADSFHNQIRLHTKRVN
jgi:hypothetical protein